MSKKAGHAFKRKREKWKAAHNESRSVFALKKNIDKHKRYNAPDHIIKAMESRLDRLS